MGGSSAAYASGVTWECAERFARVCAEGFRGVSVRKGFDAGGSGVAGLVAGEAEPGAATGSLPESHLCCEWAGGAVVRGGGLDGGGVLARAAGS